MAAGKIIRVYKGTGRRTYGNPKKSYYKKGNSVKKQIKREIRKNVEVKFYGQQWDEASVSTLNQDPSGHLRNMTTISQGVDKINRIGNKIHIIGLHVKGMLRNNGSGTNYLRFVALIPKNVIDTVDTLDSTLLEDPNGSDVPVTTGATGLNAMYYPINKESHVVLMDKVFKVSAANVDGSDSRQFNMFKKLNRNAIFTSTSATSLRSNQVLCAIFAAEGPDDTSTGVFIEFHASARLYFTDQ